MAYNKSNYKLYNFAGITSWPKGPGHLLVFSSLLIAQSHTSAVTDWSPWRAPSITILEVLMQEVAVFPSGSCCTHLSRWSSSWRGWWMGRDETGWIRGRKGIGGCGRAGNNCACQILSPHTAAFSLLSSLWMCIRFKAGAGLRRPIADKYAYQEVRGNYSLSPS